MQTEIWFGWGGKSSAAQTCALLSALRPDAAELVCLGSS